MLDGRETYGEPDGDVGVGWGAGAASVLLLAEGLDQDRVGDGSYISLAFYSLCSSASLVCMCKDRKAYVGAGFVLTGTAGIQRPHVEDVNPLHFPQNLNTLETSRLLEIGGDGAGLGTLGEEVVSTLDLCVDVSNHLVSKKVVGFCRKSWAVGGHTRKWLRLSSDAVLVALLYSNISFQS